MNGIKGKEKPQLFEWTNVFFFMELSNLFIVFFLPSSLTSRISKILLALESAVSFKTQISVLNEYTLKILPNILSPICMFFVVWKQTLILYWVTSSKWIKHPFGSKFYCLQTLTPFAWTDVEFVMIVTILLCVIFLAEVKFKL